MRKTLFMVVAFCVLLLSVPAFSAEITLQAASGGMGGSWYGQMASLSEIIMADPVAKDIKIKTVPGAGLSNPVRVESKEAQLAWGMPPYVKEAVTGTGMYKGQKPLQNIRTIAGGFTLHPLQFLVARSTGLNSIEEIKQKKYPLKVAIGRAGSVDDSSARLILDWYGIGQKTLEGWGGRVMMLEYGEQVKRLKDGQADAYILMMPVPAATVQEVLVSTPMKMLPLDPKMAKDFGKKYSFATQELPVDIYSGKVTDKKLIAPAVDLCIVVNKDMDENTAYALTKAICDNAYKVRKIAPSYKDFNPKTAWKNLGAPLHPGAAKYYREKGYME